MKQTSGKYAGKSSIPDNPSQVQHFNKQKIGIKPKAKLVYAICLDYHFEQPGAGKTFAAYIVQNSEEKLVV